MNHYSFFKYKVCSKSIETEAVFTKREMNYKWNTIFFNKYKERSKSIDIGAVFTETERNKDNFLKRFLLKHSPSQSTTNVPVSFSLVQSTAKIFFLLYEDMELYFFNFTPDMAYQPL